MGSQSTTSGPVRVKGLFALPQGPISPRPRLNCILRYNSPYTKLLAGAVSENMVEGTPARAPFRDSPAVGYRAVGRRLRRGIC